jgi:hypothetical protein
MTSKSNAGGRRDKHPQSPDAVRKKEKKEKRAAKAKYQTKLQGEQQRDGQNKMRRLSDD